MNYFKEVIYEHIAYSIAEGSKPVLIVTDTLVYQYPLLLTLGFLSVLAFELLSIVPALTNKYFCFTGCCVVAFHVMTDMVMGISFYPNVVAAIFFLIYVEGVLMRSEMSPGVSSESEDPGFNGGG